MFYDLTGAHGANGADGVWTSDFNTIHGRDGGVPADQVLLGAALAIPANEAQIGLSAIAGGGGSGGAGRDGAVQYMGGGEGGDGARGGAAVVLLQDHAFESASGETVKRTAVAQGGAGGAAGSGGDADFFAARGNAGAAGAGGLAVAEVSNIQVRSLADAVFDVELSARATAGSGGAGAAGGAPSGDPGAPTTPGQSSDGAAGGLAMARITMADVLLGAGDDSLRLVGAATSGWGHTPGGPGGDASVVMTDLTVRMGAGADRLLVAATALAGGGNDVFGESTVTFTRNHFDLGAGDDLLALGLSVGIDAAVAPSGNALEGGAGYDVLDFSGAGPVVFDFASNRLKGFERVVGGQHGDTITGARAGDVIDGASGADMLDGASGDDRLEGGHDNDTLNGGVGDDTVSGGATDDALDGGKGVDTASFAGGGAVTVDLAAGMASGAQGADALRRFENVAGSGGGDLITGGATANRLDGGVGNDTLHGGGDADVLIGGEGQDQLDGGTDSDVYVFTSVAHSIEAAPDSIISWGGHDMIDLSAIDADATQGGNQAFILAAGAPGGAPQAGVLYAIDTGAVVELHADTDDDGLYDFAVLVETDRAVTAADMVL